MKIFLLRHAKSIANEKGIVDSIGIDLGLSKKGTAEAKRLVSKLKKYMFDIIIVSPLKRSKETIKYYLKEYPKQKILTSKLILERNTGNFIGKKKEEFGVYCKKNKIKDRVSFRPKNGESLLDVYKRSKRFIKFLKNNFKDKSILICGHKMFLMCLEIALTKKDIKKFYSYESLKNNEIRKFELN